MKLSGISHWLSRVKAFLKVTPKEPKLNISVRDKVEITEDELDIESRDATSKTPKRSFITITTALLVSSVAHANTAINIATNISVQANAHLLTKTVEALSQEEVDSLIRRLSEGAESNPLREKIENNVRLGVELKRLVDGIDSPEFSKRYLNLKPSIPLKTFKEKLLRDLGEILLHPDHITQGEKGTCGAATAERALAERDPAEYVRILRELLLNGYVKLKNGETTVLNPGGLHIAEGESETRLIPSRVLQPSFIDYANADFSYDDDREKQVMLYKGKWPIVLKSSGITPSDEKRLLEGLFGIRYKVVRFTDNDKENAELLKALLSRRYRKGEGRYPVMISLNFVTNDELQRNVAKGHFVELKKLNDEKVLISNPWALSPRFYRVFGTLDGPPRVPDGSGRWGYTYMKSEDLMKRLKPVKVKLKSGKTMTISIYSIVVPEDAEH